MTVDMVISINKVRIITAIVFLILGIILTKYVGLLLGLIYGVIAAGVQFIEVFKIKLWE